MKDYEVLEKLNESFYCVSIDVIDGVCYDEIVASDKDAIKCRKMFEEQMTSSNLTGTITIRGFRLTESQLKDIDYEPQVIFDGLLDVQPHTVVTKHIL